MAKQLPPDAQRDASGVSNDLVDETASELADEELFSDPKDYSAIGGPESEPAYGRSRAIAGEYPFNEQGGPHDRDERSHVDRGGIQTHHRIEKMT